MGIAGYTLRVARETEKGLAQRDFPPSSLRKGDGEIHVLKADLDKQSKIAVRLGLAVFGSGLALFAYLGVFNRYWADDWCLNADFSTLGLWGTLKGYFYITSYTPSRFSLTLFSGLIEFLGVLGVQTLTPLIIIVWAVTLYFLLRNALTLFGEPMPATITALIVAIVVLYSIYLAPHLYQSFFWRTGILAYTAPMTAGVATLAIISQQAFSKERSRPATIGIAALAFLGGGFSEAGSTYLATALILYLAAALYWRGEKAWASNTWQIAAVALGFTGLAMLVLMLSPTAHLRMERYGEPAGFFEFWVLTFRYAFGFVRQSLLSFPLPHLAIMLATGSLSLWWAARNPDNRFGQRWAPAVAVIVLVSYFLIAASYAPSAYIEKFPPHPRTRIIARFVLTLGLATISWFVAARMAKIRIGARNLQILALLGLLLAFIYGGRSVAITATTKHPLYAQRAATWDERDGQIREAREAGIFELEVKGIDGLPVGGIRDLRPSPRYWLNECAAEYYGVDSIAASQE